MILYSLYKNTECAKYTSLKFNTMFKKAAHWYFCQVSFRQKPTVKTKVN